ncbi:serine acetyltransferase [Nostocaceae cyanobacterium CENA357]|uniref:Serine acetyltransferase n=1 Tax=Atlanticothrix silvestris CENA357 TaxID=1725252 RepID=A0A8J7L3G6_9CYAN|nr:serine O-acetyltransferase [Atlanticothrix silvestris]MBH8554960.1 serine acetyltransferase [Atlanticothrix silvestris CENA357]
MQVLNDFSWVVCKEIYKVLNDFMPSNSLFSTFEKEIITAQIYSLVWDDLCSFTERDPAARRSIEYVFRTYTCFKAVMYYRIANTLYYHTGDYEYKKPLLLQQLARRISEEAKVLTGVEIHPGAKIGSRFVIDHGTGTVIGETCEIGHDCYILQGVILGSTGIAANQAGKRHPTLGHKVEVGAFAKILGSVQIGDNVKISPGCIIRSDIPSKARVIVTNEYQIIKTEEPSNIEIYGVILKKNKELNIFGKGLRNTFLSLIDGENNEITNIAIQVIEKEDDQIKLYLKIIANKNQLKAEDIKIAISKNNSSITILNSLAVKNLLKYLINLAHLVGAQ